MHEDLRLNQQLNNRTSASFDYSRCILSSLNMSFTYFEGFIQIQLIFHSVEMLQPAKGKCPLSAFSALNIDFDLRIACSAEVVGWNIHNVGQAVATLHGYFWHGIPILTFRLLAALKWLAAGTLHSVGQRLAGLLT